MTLNHKMLEILVGRRVRLTEPLDLYPECIIPDGNTGTIVRVMDDCIWVKLDKHFPELDEWQNEAQIWNWSDEAQGTSFFYPVELID
jgi:hypothetical protein